MSTPLTIAPGSIEPKLTWICFPDFKVIKFFMALTIKTTTATQNIKSTKAKIENIIIGVVLPVVKV